MKFPLCLLPLLSHCPVAAETGSHVGLVKSIDI